MQKKTDLGIKAVSSEYRHGSAFSLFTLWFAANLTLADFALGFYSVMLKLSVFYSLLALGIGTVLGGLLLSIISVMGPATGKTQMLISEHVFKKSNILLSLLQSVNTLGWFIVNLILGVMAIIILVPTNTIILIVIYAAVQMIIAIYGHDYIHQLEKLFSIFLGVMFLYLSILILTSQKPLISTGYGYSISFIAFGIVIATSFSYIGSWSPYAADYSRYLSQKTTHFKIFLFTFFGAVLSTYWLEVLGVFVAVKTLNFNPMGAAYTLSKELGILMIIALVLGGIGTNAINIYSNSLALNSILKKSKRELLLIIAGITGVVLAVIGFQNFYNFYESFLLLLDYWIMPWAGVLIADFFYIHRGSAFRSTIAFFVGLGSSIPFMDSTWFVGPIALVLGGVDISYFVSFIISFCIYWILCKIRVKKL